MDMKFTEERLVSRRTFPVIPQVLGKSGVSVIRDKTTKIVEKVARAFYEKPGTISAEAGRIEAYYNSNNTRSSPTTAQQGFPVVQTPNAGADSDRQQLGRKKASVWNVFKDQDKHTGATSGRVPLHSVRNRFLVAMCDHSIPRTDQIDIFHCCLIG